MDGLRYLVGVTMLLIVIAGGGAGGQAIRRRLVPSWAGPPAWLADAISGIAIVVVMSELLGALGVFDAGPVVVLVALVGAGLRFGLPVGPIGTSAQTTPARPDRGHPVASMSALLGVAIVLGQWAVRLRGELRTGITEFDSQWYHLPVAARFARTGSLTTANFFSPDFPVSWHQSTSEVIHAVGIVLFERDILSIWLFAMFAGIAALAAWCIGRPAGVGAVSVLGAVAILGSTVVGLGNVGGAYSDLPAAAFFLAAVALWVQPPRELGGIVIAGASAGLALSSKLTLAGLVAGLTIAVLATASRGCRLRTALAWIGPLTVTGSFWFARNLIRAENPVPGTSLGIGPLAFPRGSYPTVDRLGYSVADYLLHPSVWRSHFIPGLEIDLGPAWPLTVGLVMVAAGAALLVGRRSKDPTMLALGAVILVGILAYLAAPTTALGERNNPLLFASNFRYAIPVLMLALIVLPTVARGRGDRAPLALVAVYGVALAFAQLGDRGGTYPAWPAHDRALGVAVIGLVVVVGSAALTLRSQLGEQRRRALLRVAPLVVVPGLAIAVGGLWVTGRQYLDDRYRTDPIDAWAQDQHSRRIAVGDVTQTYPLYGADLTNRVQWVGDIGDHAAFQRAPSCTAWRDGLRQGRYEFVVVGSTALGGDGAAAKWTAADAAASPLIETATRTLYSFDARISDTGCSVDIAEP